MHWRCRHSRSSPSAWRLFSASRCCRAACGSRRWSACCSAAFFLARTFSTSFGTQRPIADFFADLGKLLLMFFAGLEVDLALFRRAQRKAITFGVITTTLPLVLGTAVGLLFGYQMVTAVVMGSLLASHTLLGMPIVTKIGANRLEPFIVTVGATVLSDTLSLVVFAMCVSTFERRLFGVRSRVATVEIVVFVPLLLFIVGRGGRYLLKKAEDDERAYFVLMLGIMAAAVAVTRFVQLPGIVGAFLAGLAVNSAVQQKARKGEAGVHRQLSSSSRSFSSSPAL